MRPVGTDRDILRLAVPALGALVAEPIYVVTDTAIVGHLGTDALAGLAVAVTILLTGYSVFIFLAYGTTAAVARLLGAGDERGAAAQAVQSIWLAAGIGVVLAALGAATSGALVGAFTGDDAVRAGAELYLRVSLVGIPATLVTFAGVGYLRGLQDTRRPLMVAAGTAVLNLVLEVVLIYGLGRGLGASAAATVVAQWVAAGIYLGWVGRIVGALGIGLAPRPEAIAGLARVGVHLLVRTAALRGAFVAATAVAARIGTTELAAHEIAWQFWNLLALVLDALAIAGQALVGRALGGGDALEARAVAARVVHWGLWLGVVLGVATATVAPVLPRVFSGDGAVRALATFLLLWVAVMQPINGVVFAWDGILIGAGDQRYLALAMAGAAALFVPAAVAVAWLGLGIGWLWAALVGFMAARMVPLSARGRRGAWAVPGAVR